MLVELCVFRPVEKRHEPYLERCRSRCALGELERWRASHSGPWFTGERLTQAEITITCCWTLVESVALEMSPDRNLASLAAGPALRFPCVLSQRESTAVWRWRFTTSA
jgi:glutathione S-transferase